MNNENKTTRRPKVAWILTHRIQYFVNLIDTLHQRGDIEVGLFLGCAPGLIDDKEFGKKVIWDNRVETSFPEYYLQQQNKPLSGFLKSYSSRLSAELDKWQPDYIYINGYTDAIAWQAFLWARLNGKPYALRCDGDTLVPRHPLKAMIRKPLAALMTRTAHRVTFQGRENRKFWKNNGAREESLVWIPCVPDSELYRHKAFADLEQREAFRANLGAAPDDVIAVVNGKLVERKRPQDAVEVVGKLRGSKLRVWFLGSGDLEEHLKAMSKELGVTEKVTFLGFCNQSEIPIILQAADFLLHPSSLDPWPYSILEAAISGNALALSNKTGSYPDWMESPASGVTFRCGDIEDMAKSISLLLNDPDFLKTSSINACKRSDGYTEDVFCGIFEEFVLEACL